MNFAEQMRKRVDEVIEENTKFSEQYYIKTVRPTIEKRANKGWSSLNIFGCALDFIMPSNVIPKVILDQAKADGFDVDEECGIIRW